LANKTPPLTWLSEIVNHKQLRATNMYVHFSSHKQPNSGMCAKLPPGRKQGKSGVSPGVATHPETNYVAFAPMQKTNHFFAPRKATGVNT
jgi:hypothetical protein